VILKKLALHHFKNHSGNFFSFHPGLNWLAGVNGSGKSNVLDAIHYLSLGRSYFSGGDAASIPFTKNYFKVEGDFLSGTDSLHIVCRQQIGEKKELMCNNIPYRKMSEHIGKLPVMMIEPDDHSIVDGNSEERRKLIDSVLSQIHSQYLQALLGYQKVLQQRNFYLKQFQISGSWNEELVASWDEQLHAFGKIIFKLRKKLVEWLKPEINSIYAVLCEHEEVSIEYKSDLNDHEFISLLKEKRNEDKQFGRTTAGIHTDDFDLLMNGRLVRKFASQGQRKSWLLALKLSLWNAMKNETGIAPILLLDDVFDKLDWQRSVNLLEWIIAQNVQSIFTEATIDKVNQLMKEVNVTHHTILMENPSQTVILHSDSN
jgi:DNA replication and repair protein RecF